MNITNKFLNNNFYAAERKNTNDSIKIFVLLCYRTLGSIEKKGEVEFDEKRKIFKISFRQPLFTF